MVKRALLWVAYAVKPLSIEKLAAAACIIPEENATPFDPAHQIIEAKSIIDILSSMVTATPRSFLSRRVEAPNTQCLLLAHFSVKEYLNSERLRINSASVFYMTDLSAH